MTKLLNRTFFCTPFKNGALGQHFKSRAKKSNLKFCHEIVFNYFFHVSKVTVGFQAFINYHFDGSNKK